MMRDPAEKDMATLLSKLDSKKSSLSAKIVNASPKTYIPQRAKKIEADFIVIGTTGLTDLKNMTIGSVTEYIVKHTKIPVISIPKNAIFRNFNKIVLGVDDKLLKRPNSLLGIKKFIFKKKVKLFIVQVYKNPDSYLKIDDAVMEHFADKRTEVIPLLFDQSISRSINNFAEEVKAQLVCIIHHKRNWLLDIFHHSILKEELFSQDLPILIIPD